MSQTTQQCKDGIHAYTCWVKLVLYTVFVVVLKKVVSFIIVPIVYPFRKLIAFRSDVEHDWQLDEIKKRNKWWQLFIWMWFDDSVWAERRKDWAEYGVPKILWKSDFFATWWWCGIRNGSNNLSHLMSLGEMVEVLCHHEGRDYWWEVRQYENGKIACYFEWWLGNCRLKWGWMRSGKYAGPSIRCFDDTEAKRQKKQGFMNAR